MIQPTVGRKVWFYNSVLAAMDPNTQPQDATVVYVVNDRLVNLRVSDYNGDQSPKLAVQLYQEGDEDPKGEFACWMPYESTQAKKAAEPKLTEDEVQRIATQILGRSVKGLEDRLEELSKKVSELTNHKAAQVPSPPTATPEQKVAPATAPSVPKVSK